MNIVSVVVIEIVIDSIWKSEKNRSRLRSRSRPRVMPEAARRQTAFARALSPHFSPAFYCGVGSGHVYCVALGRAPRRTVEYAYGALGRAPCIHARLRCLATKTGEKCGLAPFYFFSPAGTALGAALSMRMTSSIAACSSRSIPFTSSVEVFCTHTSGGTP